MSGRLYEGRSLAEARQAPEVLRGGALSHLSPFLTELALGRGDVLCSLRGISLDQLNSRASMLERMDNKYIVAAHIVRHALASWSSSFDILDISGRRAFSYETCYFDDEARTSFHNHRQGKRRRFKVRTRRYVDTGLCFLEVKLKGKRGITIKHRLPYRWESFRRLDARARRYILDVYAGEYGETFDFDLVPVLEVRFRRVTLISRRAPERLTMDANLSFRGAKGSCVADTGTFIIEAKSANGNGAADKLMRSLNQHPVRRCSKYCIGMAAVTEVHRCNRFLPAMRKLKIDPDSRVLVKMA